MAVQCQKSFFRRKRVIKPIVILFCMVKVLMLIYILFMNLSRRLNSFVETLI